MSALLIITGGSRGIGKATLERFVKDGWDCINLSRSPCDLKGITNITCNLLDADWDKGLTLPALDQYEKIALVHNAGVCFNDQVQDMPAENLMQSLTLSVIAPSRLNQLILPSLKSGSSILYIGSTLSEQAVPGSASYVTSKHANIGLMRATCQDLADTGIHTCCICPGITDTEMLRERAGHNPEILAKMAQIQTANRLIKPSEIADVIWFCANHTVMNGAVVHSNLGQRGA